MAEAFTQRLLFMKISFTVCPNNAHSATQKHLQPIHTGKLKVNLCTFHQHNK